MQAESPAEPTAVKNAASLHGKTKIRNKTPHTGGSSKHCEQKHGGDENICTMIYAVAYTKPTRKAKASYAKDSAQTGTH